MDESHWEYFWKREQARIRLLQLGELVGFLMTEVPTFDREQLFGDAIWSLIRELALELVDGFRTSYVSRESIERLLVVWGVAGRRC